MLEMKNATFCIVVITRNRGERIRPALRSIKDIRYPPDRYEVIVVDNGSTDNTAGVVAQELADALFSWKVVTENVKGICRARNTGWRAAGGNWVIYLDDDAIVPEQWLIAYAEALDAYPEAVVFGGPASLDENLVRPWWWCRKFDWTMSCQDYGEELKPYPDGGHPYGLNMMIRRDVLRQTRGFDLRLDDETSSFADETELFIRLMKTGARLIYVPGTRVVHCVEQDRLAWKPYMDRRELVGRSHAYLDHNHNTDFRHPLLKHFRIALEDFCSFLTPAVFVQEMREWRGYRKYIKEVAGILP